MKLKYTGTEPDIENSLALLEQLRRENIVNDNDSILGVDEDMIELTGVYPSEDLTRVMEQHPDFMIQTTPDETDPFMAEDGLADKDKISTVPTQETLVEEDNFDLNEVQLFSDSDLEEAQEELEPNNDNLNSNMRKKFNEELPVEQEELDVNEVDLFTEEELEAAESDENQSEIEAFSEEEIDEMKSVEEVEEATEKIEEADEAFCDNQKKLFAAKRKLRRVNSKYANRRNFTEELTEKEQSEVVDDIVAILQDSPEILGAVAEEVEMLKGPELTETFNEEVSEAPEAEVKEVEEKDEVVEAFTDEEIAEAEGEEAEEDEVETFSEEEIEESEEEIVEDDDDDDDEDEDSEETRVGAVFARAFAEDTVAATRMAMLADMRKK